MTGPVSRYRHSNTHVADWRHGRFRLFAEPTIRMGNPAGNMCVMYQVTWIFAIRFPPIHTVIPVTQQEQEFGQIIIPPNNLIDVRKETAAWDSSSSSSLYWG